MQNNNDNRQRGENHWTQRKKLESQTITEPETPTQSAFVPEVQVSEATVAEMTEREKYNAEIARIRKTRKPFGSFHQKLVLSKRPGYHRHWFNDVPGRVDEAKASGWTHVEDKDGNPIKRIVGQGRSGGGLLAYAMEIPDVFWEEDMAEQDKLARAPLEAIKGNPVQAKPGQAKPEDNSKFYSPREQILDIQRR